MKTYLTTLKQALSLSKRRTVTIQLKGHSEQPELYKEPAHQAETPKLIYLRENSQSNNIELVLVIEHKNKPKEERYFEVDDLNLAGMLSFIAEQASKKIIKKHDNSTNANGTIN